MSLQETLAEIDRVFRDNEGALWQAVAALSPGIALSVNERRRAGARFEDLAVVVADSSLCEVDPACKLTPEQLGAGVVEVRELRDLVTRLARKGRAPRAWRRVVEGPASARCLHILAVTRGRVALSQMIFRMSSLDGAGAVVDLASVHDEDVRDALLMERTAGRAPHLDGLDREQLLELVRKNKPAIVSELLARQAAPGRPAAAPARA